MKKHLLPWIVGLTGLFALATAFGTSDAPLDTPEDGDASLGEENSEERGEILRNQSRDDKVLRYWTELVENHSFEEVLAVFSAGPDEEWPAVHSALFPAEQEVAVHEAAYRVLEERLLDGLESFALGLRGLNEPEFLDCAERLLDMRDQFAQHAAYANLLFADAIASCVAANLGARLVGQSGVSEKMLDLLDRLKNGQPGLDSFREMVCGELAGKCPEEQDGSLPTESGGTEPLAAYWEFLMPGIPVGWPGPETCIYPKPLLHLQGLDGMLVRLTGLDMTIHSLLPSMALYRKTAPNAPPKATYQDFKSVLGDDTETPASLGSGVWGLKRAAAAANELVSEVDSGKIWLRTAFSQEQMIKWQKARRLGTCGQKSDD